jgi:hypothetical protein
MSGLYIIINKFDKKNYHFYTTLLFLIKIQVIKLIIYKDSKNLN